VKNEKTPESPRDKKERKKFSPKKLLAITLAAGSLALPLAGCGDKAVDASPTPNPDKTELPSSPTPGASQSASPEASPSPTETAEAIPTVESLEVDKSLLNDPEELVQAVNGELIVEWTNAGATPENAQAAINSDLSIPEFAANIVAKYDDIYADALFIKGWENHPDLVDQVERIKQNHLSTITSFIDTSFPDVNPDDKEPYKFGNKIKLGEVVKSIEDYVLLTSIETIDDNSDQNRVGEDLTGGKNNNGKSATSAVGFEIQGGKVKISEWSQIGAKY
jgi:hypothetical protein